LIIHAVPNKKADIGRLYILQKFTTKTRRARSFFRKLSVGRFRASKPPIDAQYPKQSTIKNPLVRVSGRGRRDHIPIMADCWRESALQLYEFIPLNPPDKDFHLARNDKLRLSHRIRLTALFHVQVNFNDGILTSGFL